MTTVKPTVTASYTLQLPAGIEYPPSLTPTVTHTFPLDNGSSHDALDSDSSMASADVREYYDGVRAAIAAARLKLGEELTAWRDAASNWEGGKERKLKVAKDEEDEEEGEP
ncbi:hypothetical protein EDD15DRAFT_2162287 [Pisolithus albus]|nr:hypothetical protein EDD15DRAFT_2162287 [Pisolithus albus]